MKMRTPSRICYINITDTIPPRDVPYVRGLEAVGVTIVRITDSAPGIRKYFRLWKRIRQESRSSDLMWIGYSGHVLPLLVRLATRKKVVFNALSPLYEGIVVSRGKRSLANLWGTVPWLIDFIGFRSVNAVLVETDAQAAYCSRLLMLPRTKFIRSWTGVDETIFHPDPNVKKLPRFTALFRGALLPESGIMVLAQAAHILRNEPIAFRIIGDGMLADRLERFLNEKSLPNLEWIRKRLPNNELREKMLQCHLSLGQLSTHDRLKHTIPHKVFESVVMKLPYLTARGGAVHELLLEGRTCLAFEPGNSDDLARMIRELSHDPASLDSVSRRAYDDLTAVFEPGALVRTIMPAL